MARGPRKESTTVYLEPGQLQQLEELTQKTGVPTAVYIRRAITACIPAFEREGAAIKEIIEKTDRGIDEAMGARQS